MKTIEEFANCIDETNSNLLKLTKWMYYNNFFETPASTKWHGNYKGGLAVHCNRVLEIYKNILPNPTISEESMLLCAFGHDLCKVKTYIFQRDGKIGYDFKWMKENPGHGVRSIIMLEELGIELTSLEKDIIKYHMGPYGTHEFGSRFAEYSFKDLMKAWEQTEVKLFYFADDISSKMEK